MNTCLCGRSFFGQSIGHFWCSGCGQGVLACKCEPLDRKGDVEERADRFERLLKSSPHNAPSCPVLPEHEYMLWGRR